MPTLLNARYECANRLARRRVFRDGRHVSVVCFAVASPDTFKYGIAQPCSSLWLAADARHWHVARAATCCHWRTSHL